MYFFMIFSNFVIYQWTIKLKHAQIKSNPAIKMEACELKWNEICIDTQTCPQSSTV